MQSIFNCNFKAKFVAMNIVDRLKDYMDYIGMASTQFADVANIPRPTISQILNGRNRKISNEVIEKLHQGFPDLNIMWLLFGDGDMKVALRNRGQEQSVQYFPNTTHSSVSNNGPQFSSFPNPGDKNSSPMQSSNIDEFVNDTVHNRINVEENALASHQVSSIPVSATSKEKKIKYIMVFFNDNSFEVLRPTDSI